MASSSSSSSTMKKTTKVSQIQQTVFQKSLIRRQETVFKKAYELSILCGIEVCVICYGSDGELKTWPQDREKVKDIARRYSELSKTKRLRGSVNLSEFLEKINKDDFKNKKKKVRRGSQVKYPVWDSRFDNYSVEQLTELIQSLERNLTRIQHRIGVVKARGQRRTHNTNMADEELMMASTMNHLQQHSNQNTNMANQKLMMTSTMNYLQQHSNQNTNMANQNLMMTSTMNHLQQHSNQNTNMANQNLMMTSTMNHLQQHSNQNTNMANQNLMMTSTMNQFQQHSNQVSLYHENGIFSQFPVSASSLNQAQSLALIPSARTIYPNWNVGNYSRSLGVQETGINGFQNMNMCTYDNNNIINGVNDFPKQIDQNFKVESYFGLLGMEEYGINEFESTNMYSRNLNTEDYLELLGGQETGNNALQNVNMHDYNNANGLHQLGQFLTPTAAGGFQFGSDGNNIRSLYQI